MSATDDRHPGDITLELALAEITRLRRGILNEAQGALRIEGPDDANPDGNNPELTPREQKDLRDRLIWLATPQETIAQADALLTKYRDARNAWERIRATQSQRWLDQASEREDHAFNALVDFLEANDLNYTRWDPR